MTIDDNRWQWMIIDDSRYQSMPIKKHKFFGHQLVIDFRYQLIVIDCHRLPSIVIDCYQSSISSIDQAGVDVLEQPYGIQPQNPGRRVLRLHDQATECANTSPKNVSKPSTKSLQCPVTSTHMSWMRSTQSFMLSKTSLIARMKKPKGQPAKENVT